MIGLAVLAAPVLPRLLRGVRQEMPLAQLTRS
jgi:hypothetical protein